MLKLFVSGSDKNKAIVTAGLSATMQSLGYSTSVYKPIQTGAIDHDGFIQAPDLAFVKFIDSYIKTYFTYLLKNPALPILSAELENTTIDKDTIAEDFLSIHDECVIVDGTDGLFTPLADGLAELNLAKNLNLPVLMSVSPLDENIGDIIATINCAYMSNVWFRGVIINGYPSEYTEIGNLNIKSFPRLIERYTNAKVLGILPQLSRNIKPNDLISEILTGVDLESVFDVKIAKLEA